MYNIKIIDWVSDNERRSRVFPAIKYSTVEKVTDNGKLTILTYWEKKNVCSQIYVTSSPDAIPDEKHEAVFEAYIMNDEGQTIEVIS